MSRFPSGTYEDKYRDLIRRADGDRLNAFAFLDRALEGLRRKETDAGFSDPDNAFTFALDHRPPSLLNVTKILDEHNPQLRMLPLVPLEDQTASTSKQPLHPAQILSDIHWEMALTLRMRHRLPLPIHGPYQRPPLSPCQPCRCRCLPSPCPPQKRM